ncbi:MAG: vitamin K epoxide reductase family protein [Cyanobacteriota bacterium]
MTRRRSTPWIHRWSRLLIGAIAVIGAILTGYLTVTKLAGGDVGCLPTEAAQAAGNSCNDVLDSRYGQVFGLPLTLFGCLAYLSMATFALGPLAVNREVNKSLRARLEEWTWLFLLIGGTAMTVFSGYLMYILAVELQVPCIYCITSAVFALTLLTLTILGRDWDDIGQILFTGIIVAMVTLVATLGIYSIPDGSSVSGRIPVLLPTTEAQPPIGWEITTTSGESEIALAEHLTEVGASNYGTFWCPYCYSQKQLFGEEAFSKVNYVECDPSGIEPQPGLCQEAGIRSYPSWEINGQLYSGTQSLEQLAEVSGYSGPRNFKYTFTAR